MRHRCQFWTFHEHCDLQLCQTATSFAWFPIPRNEDSVVEGQFHCMCAGHLEGSTAADEIGAATASEAAVAAAREVELEQLQRQEAEDRLAEALAQVSRPLLCGKFIPVVLIRYIKV